MRDFIMEGRTTEDVKSLLKQSRKYDEYHPRYIKNKVYPILEKAFGDKHKFNGVRQEIDRHFLI